MLVGQGFSQFCKRARIVFFARSMLLSGVSAQLHIENCIGTGFQIEKSKSDKIPFRIYYLFKLGQQASDLV